MTNYFLKRILWFIPTLIGISIVIFLISIKAPGNPIDQIIDRQEKNSKSVISKQLIEAKLKTLSAQFHLDKPLFYFSISNQTQSDTLYRILDKITRENLSAIAYECANWESVNQYYKNLKLLETANASIHSIEISQFAHSLKQKNSIHVIQKELELFQSKYPEIPLTNNLSKSIESLSANYPAFKHYLPKINFYGLNNQYHIWISNFLKGNFGISYIDRQEVSTKIIAALKWTLAISCLSILISYLIAIPLGVYLAKINGSKLDHFISSLLFSIHSIPSFWLATLLILFFANEEYFHWFSSYGVGDYDKDQSIFSQLTTLLYHFTLPLICWTYASLAYITEQIKRSMLLHLQSDYIITARAKGLSERKILWKHAFKNASFPLITQIANLFPALLAGSFVIEYIFAIPGIGKLLITSIQYRDYPTLFGILMLSSILVMLGILISDLLYHRLDPRIDSLSATIKNTTF